MKAHRHARVLLYEGLVGTDGALHTRIYWCGECGAVGRQYGYLQKRQKRTAAAVKTNQAELW